MAKGTGGKHGARHHMTTKRSAGIKTEPEFEADIRAAVRRVLPWLSEEEIRHQTTFKFKFGHADVTIDGRDRSKVSARSDVMILIAEEPVAVLELKRPGIGISEDDVEQGLSYARMSHPRPPLVIVTDGTDTRIIESHSGKAWVIDFTRSLIREKLSG